MRVTRPSLGAGSSFSIFIASTTTTPCPAFTSCPSRASTAAILPGMIARTSTGPSCTSAAAAAAALVQEGPVEVRAIMPGRIAAVLAREGQEVKAGQGVVVVEAMKMENELPAPRDGRVTRIRVRPGETVEAGTALFTVG